LILIGHVISYLNTFERALLCKHLIYTFRVKSCSNGVNMPIIVKDFTWEQTEKMLFLTLPLKGVVKHKVDILTTEAYIKVG
jgi:hypothetical protein